MKQSDDSVIKIENISKRYQNKIVFQDFSWELKQGVIMGLLGPNGAGKTTLMEMIAGLRMADAGSIEVLGLSPQKDRENLFKKIGIQTQDFAFQPKLKVKEALRFFASLHKNALSVDGLLEELELTQQKRTYFTQLSGGQKQRLSLAKSLIGNPELLLLDEPTAGLDPHGHKFLMEKIRSLKNEAKTLIISMHNMEDAHKLCDQVTIIDFGKVIETGKPDDLIKKHIGAATYTIHFHGEAEAKMGEFQKFVQEDANYLGWVKERNSITVYTQRLEDAWLHDYVEKNQLSQEVKSATLEDVFLKLTGRSLRE